MLKLYRAIIYIYIYIVLLYNLLFNILIFILHIILQIIIDGRDRNAVDECGFRLPTVVYMAREKRPNYPHHFKGGAINSLVTNP